MQQTNPNPKDPRPYKARKPKQILLHIPRPGKADESDIRMYQGNRLKYSSKKTTR